VQIAHVRYFLALCRDKTFTLAAKRCGVSQPSLTNAIKRFERELGGQLFCRSATKTTLTEFGEAIRPYLERLAQCTDDALRVAAGISSLPQDASSTMNGGLHAQAHAFHRRRRSRRVGDNNHDQGAILVGGAGHTAADNLD
jgi:DNA-binding transcriptional LysR family regulator